MEEKKEFYQDSLNSKDEDMVVGGTRASLAGSQSSKFMHRFFTYEGKSPYEFDIYGNPIKWISEDVSVTDDRGKVVFTQPKIRRPEFWSALAIKVVASKYFWGDMAKGEREDGVDKLIGRVSEFMARQTLLQGYLNDEQSNIFI